jgi:predicted DsbA family dithiol-disulfide isomerase
MKHPCTGRRPIARAGTTLVFALLAFTAFTPLLLGAAAPQTSSSGPAASTAALINGETITEDQLLSVAAADLQQLASRPPSDERTMARNRLAIMHKALDTVAEEKLLALEAAKLQTTPQQIVQAEITSNVVVPSDEDVVAAYERNKANIRAPRDEALVQLRQQMIDRSRNAYRDALLRRLKRDYGFRSLLDPLRAEVATAGYPSRGPAAARVTIVEFSDFECPFCGRLFPALKNIERSYPNSVRIVYRQFPLTNIHPYAQKAAEASLCAGEQDRFWEMHDSMFGFQDDLTVPSLKMRAAELNLDVTAFSACLDSGKHAETIRKDKEDAATLGVTGTPTLFVNGRMILGNQPAELRALIDDEIARK